MDQHTYSAQTSITISEDKPENYHVVAYELTDRANQTTLTLTQSNNPTQQDADSMVEQGWKPIPHALRACLANTSAQGLDELLPLDKRSSRRYTVPTTRGDGASEIAVDSSTSEIIEAGNALSNELTGLLRHPARSSYRGGKPAGSSVWNLGTP